MAYLNTKVRERQTVTPTSQSQNLGVVSVVPMDAWSGSVSYEKLNIVTHNGGTFIAKRKNIGVEPLVAAGWQDSWMLLTFGGPTKTSDLLNDGNGESPFATEEALKTAIENAITKTLNTPV